MYYIMLVFENTIRVHVCLCHLKSDGVCFELCTLTFLPIIKAHIRFPPSTFYYCYIPITHALYSVEAILLYNDFSNSLSIIHPFRPESVFNRG